ncbi:MAG: tRNA pseudouridine(55) synthase TruB [Bacteroidales bacterium]|nr:tRNA pseudouridine(55) synthase TruB [Bacteroidales bacterium]
MLKNPTVHSTVFQLPELEVNIEEDVLLVDKPIRCTSFDIVGKVRGIVQRKANRRVKVGHAGTLDPLATGLLIICIGKKTKQIDQIQQQTKEYTGTFRMGATTPSFDLEHPVDAMMPYEHITREMAEAVAHSMTGPLEQAPPLFSAVRCNGHRAYILARKGQEAQLETKSITIYEFELTRFELPEIDFRIRCSKGTYIRSVARDFGAALQSGAHLTALRRTRIGDYRVEEAIKPIILSSGERPDNKKETE